jgi:hypothetical protein
MLIIILYYSFGSVKMHPYVKTSRRKMCGTHESALSGDKNQQNPQVAFTPAQGLGYSVSKATDYGLDGRC